MNNTIAVFDNLTGQRERAVFLSLLHNPVMNRAQSLTQPAKTQFVSSVFGQYYGLVVEITHFLSQMILVTMEESCPAVTRELRRNLAEESGSRTEGLPHRILLSRALRNELQLEVEQYRRSEETHSFLAGLMSSLYNRAAAFGLGVIYALEDTASAEVLVVGAITATIYEGVTVQRLTDKQLSLTDRNLPAHELSLEGFFRRHIVDFEIGHQQGLQKAITQDMNLDFPIHEFTAGYEYTLTAMHKWWEHLATL